MSPALYAARVGDLVRWPTVTVECLDCRRRTEVQVEVLRARLPAWERVLDLGRNMRCENNTSIPR
jgi:hypothetical protein